MRLPGMEVAVLAFALACGLIGAVLWLRLLEGAAVFSPPPAYAAAKEACGGTVFALLDDRGVIKAYVCGEGSLRVKGHQPKKEQRK